MKTIVITIGDEVTSGHTVNTNAAWMAKALEPLGITPERVVTMRDDVAALTKEIRAAAKRYDLVLITGGLGPTHDDVTKPALVKTFNTRLVRDAATLRHVKRFFKNIDLPMPQVNVGQADVPEGCVVIRNRFGTAPCLHFDTGSCLVFALPGVPYEMKGIMEQEVLPRLKKRAPKGALARVSLRTIGIGESSLYTMIEEAGGVDSDIELAYLPHFGQVDLRLTAHAKTEKQARAKLRRAERKLMRMIAPYLFGIDDETLEGAVGKVLIVKGLTLASAESCTGGLFASRITSVSGSSAYFLEGMVTYSNDAKIGRLKVKKSTIIKHGAVSSQTAAEMARNICKLSGADIGVSSTGVAGPTGGTKDKPVGLVYIGLCHGGAVRTRELRLGMDRHRIQDRTVKEMLTWIFHTAKHL